MTMNPQLSGINNGGASFFEGIEEPANSGTLPLANQGWLGTQPFSDNASSLGGENSWGGGWGGNADADAGGATEASEVSELSSLLAQVASLLPGLVQNAGSQGQAGTLNGIPSGYSNGSPSGYFNGNPLACSSGNQNLGSQQALLTSSPLTGGQSQAQTQTPYTNFQASSVGDPHDSFSATTANGQSTASHWDNMQSHHDLLDSSSFAGGLRVSSDVTSTQGNGATMNGAVDIHTNFGKNDIHYDADGDASVEQNGSWQGIAPGTQLTLADGTTLADSSTNQLTVSKNNGMGGSLSTVLNANGQGGVDIQAQGQNINAGGYLTQSGSPFNTTNVNNTNWA